MLYDTLTLQDGARIANQKGPVNIGDRPIT